MVQNRLGTLMEQILHPAVTECDLGVPGLHDVEQEWPLFRWVCEEEEDRARETGKQPPYCLLRT